MSLDSRERMVRSAALLFREQGLTGTGFRDVIAHSGAPRGSIYHHFPGGKAQLAEEAVRWAGETIGIALEASARDGDPIAALRAGLAAWRHTLISSDFRAGCPVVAVATVAHDDAPQLAAAAAAAFTRWEDAFAAALRKAGLDSTRAATLATLAFAAMEGAIVFCRARRDTKPLDDVGRELELAIRSALPSSPRASAG